MFRSEPQVRKGHDGEVRTIRQAVQLGVLSGWTVKETAFTTGWAIHSLQSRAHRMKVSFSYGGTGPKPRYWTPMVGTTPPDAIC